MGNKLMRKLIAVFVAAAMMMTCGLSVFAATPSTTVGKVGTVTSYVYNSNKSIKVMWKPVENATSYIVHVGSKTVTVGKDVTSTTVTGLKAGSRYSVYIEAKNDKSGDVQKSSTDKRWVKATTKVTAKKSGKTVKLSWKKVSKAVKYKVVVYKNGAKYKSYTTKSLKKTFKSLKKGTYKFTVAPVYSNSYVGASKSKTVTVK